MGRADVPHDRRAARRTSDPSSSSSSVPWPVTPERDPRAGRARRAGAGRDAARARPRRAALALGRRRRQRSGAGRRAVPADARRTRPGWRWSASGVIGEPTSVQVSSTHLYHAVSMIRGLLGVGFEPATVSRARLHRAAGRPAQPAGWTRRRHPEAAATTLATIDFGGAAGPVRLHRQPVVEPAAHPADRGPRQPRRAGRRPGGAAGRRHDDRRVGADPPPDRAATSTSRPRPGAHQLRRRRGLPQPLRRRGLSDEEIAIADILPRRRVGARRGPGAVPLAEACQDHLISLAIDESVRTGRPVVTAPEASLSPHGDRRARGGALAPARSARCRTRPTPTGPTRTPSTRRAATSPGRRLRVSESGNQYLLLFWDRNRLTEVESPSRRQPPSMSTRTAS